jgi:hypothetical protein
MLELTSANVRNVVNASMFAAEDVINGVPVREPLTVKGLNVQLSFDPQRVTANKSQVRELVEQLSPAFRDQNGMSFMGLPVRSDGVQWGQYRNADELVCLGLATGDLVLIPADRADWKDLPGKLPYVAIVAIESEG